MENAPTRRGSFSTCTYAVVSNPTGRNRTFPAMTAVGRLTDSEIV